MKHGIATIIQLTLLLTLSCVSSAAPGDAWESGKQAFGDGDFLSALTYFESARDAGLQGPAVHYNIAVSQYELGRYRDAGETFSLIARRFPKMRGLAEYNLGLVARKLGERRDARAHFLRAYELSSDNLKIRVLASRRLRELQPDRRAASRWTGAVGFRAGNDDNVALRDEAGLPVGATTDSPMADVFGSISGPWDANDGLHFEGSAYLVRYSDADEFDQAGIRGGVFYEFRPDDWRFQAGIHAGTTTLGGDAFDRKIGAHLRLVRYFNSSGSIDVRYTYDDVTDADALFAGIAGSRQQVDARYRWYRDDHRVQLRFSNETNDRLDPGVSPDRTRLGFNYRFQPETGLGFEAGAEFRSSDYDDAVIPRQEDLLTLRAALTYAWRNNWLLLLELRHSDNDSTDSTFSYDRSQVTIGGIKYF